MRLNDSAGGFREPQTFDFGHAGGWVHAADMNRDHRLDIVVTDSDVTSVLLQGTTGWFRAPIMFSPRFGEGLTNVVADIDEDGVPDQLVTDSPGPGKPARQLLPGRRRRRLSVDAAADRGGRARHTGLRARHRRRRTRRRRRRRRRPADGVAGDRPAADPGVPGFGGLVGVRGAGRRRDRCATTADDLKRRRRPAGSRRSVDFRCRHRRVPDQFRRLRGTGATRAGDLQRRRALRADGRGRAVGVAGDPRRVSPHGSSGGAHRHRLARSSASPAQQARLDRPARRARPAPQAPREPTVPRARQGRRGRPAPRARPAPPAGPDATPRSHAASCAAADRQA